MLRCMIVENDVGRPGVFKSAWNSLDTKNCYNLRARELDCGERDMSSYRSRNEQILAELLSSIQEAPSEQLN
ncbi:hypothetical protein GBAR_LOCUS7404 [Geodia barretti]|uniref:Uncharacterized protein n=1 Tax=Geodia barretti TaxID=519541 RepID=A0AA35RJM0_GEOBA|nr:hypothetical protein GBAR_LOCUS7404 [Geodia barretti]